jgi:hypothetical protein
MEIIAVIALSEARYSSFVEGISNERQRLIQIVLGIVSIVPLRSITGFPLPIPAQEGTNWLRAQLGQTTYRRKMVRTRGTRSSRGSSAYIAAPSIGPNTY